MAAGQRVIGGISGRAMRPLRLWRAGFSPVILADRARDAGQWSVAARLYRKALDRNPRNPPIWVQYGQVMKEWGNVAEAGRAYRKEIELDPNAADSHRKLGHAVDARTGKNGRYLVVGLPCSRAISASRGAELRLS
jgi:tetratricopeptide (TPR) repeat protein